jgi:hypothetical protein
MQARTGQAHVQQRVAFRLKEFLALRALHTAYGLDAA